MKDKPRSTNGLMKYLRDAKGINIGGSNQKKKFMNMGFYHGYKGYRYIYDSSKQINYTNFEELSAIYNFDSKLKALFYPSVMFIETALKNYVLESMIEIVKSDSFIVIYNSLLDNYKMFSVAGKTFSDPKKRQNAEEKYKNSLKSRLDLRNRIYRVQTDAFKNGNKIATHYLSNDRNLPIWATFELLSLGEFGHFVSCLNKNCRTNISKRLGIKQSDDQNAMLVQRLVYSTKDLRNAIAHNDVIFDTRFRSNNIDKQVSNAIFNETGVKNIDFTTITDYLVLIIYILSLLNVTKTELRKIISDYEDIIEKLRSDIPTSVYMSILHSDFKQKISALKAYIKSK